MLKKSNISEEYFKKNKDDALILHSHKFLDNKSNHEKDFIVLNVTKGMVIQGMDF